MKRILSLILSLALILVLLSAFCVSALASDADGSTPLVVLSNEAQALSGNALVVDNAELLSGAERERLEARAQSISAAHGCEVIVLTVNGTGGKSAQDYAEDYYVDHRYGFGTDRSGILLLLDMGERDWYIATCGSAIDAFHDDPIDFLVSRFTPSLSDGDYYEAFTIYYDYAEKFLGYYDGSLSQEDAEEIDTEYSNYMNGTEPAKPNYVKKGIVAVLLGGLAGFIPVSAQKSALKTVRKRHDAAGYAKEGSLNLYVNRDIYLYSNVTSHVIQQQRTEGSGPSHSIGSGSSSTHTHSSGTTFGGHGGKF